MKSKNVPFKSQPLPQSSDCIDHYNALRLASSSGVFNYDGSKFFSNVNTHAQFT